MGKMGMAEILDWSTEDFHTIFEELEKQEMVKADWKARIVWIPNAIKYNPPESPNVVSSWATIFEELPECALLNEAEQQIRNYLTEMGPAYIAAWELASKRQWRPTRIPSEIARQVRERDGDTCRYCNKPVNWQDRKGRSGATYDHVDPSGQNSLENLVVTCRECNSKKSFRTPDQAQMYLIPITDKSLIDQNTITDKSINQEQEQEQEQELNTLVQKSVQTHEKTKNEKHLKGFEQFWNAYPRKQNRGRAEKAWQSLAPSEPLTVKILQAVEEAKTSEDWRKEGGQFIPHPSSWLNAKGWLDEGLDLKAMNTSTGPPKPVVSSSSKLPTPPTDEEREASLQAMREAKKNLPWLDLGGGDRPLPEQKVEAEKPPNEPIIPVRSLDGLINGLTGKLSMTG